ncbi:helix-turn-helix transcriptional regulator [Metabacillus sediminilitoris]|uniref:Helix-turn-helix transcriptional regulator n=1 Tax=Metabacillus sediminilitoris TaxID=2567941 RepID=A0A4S4BR26_9BACI|nr:helix-turn-helix transcriptional regulator [Metabacillus sediminilitoris]QGQ45894.1 helix-turn-helix domain-containing protein [Metabacillus sediminilitoris]THF75076.1 helix-turn-helix transcriptional regulator [Metabacillus sediminilitoris]
MNKEKVIDIISAKIRLIRLEKRYSQEKMADILGISKKTLVQIEKGRMLAGWSNSVVLCSLFRDSEVLQSVLGDEPLEVIETIAHNGIDKPKDKTMGGRIWWKEIDKKGSFRLQQNLVSKHYRIIDEQQYRWFSSFDQQEALMRLNEMYSEE